jgi:hypothetical protein
MATKGPEILFCLMNIIKIALSIRCGGLDVGSNTGRVATQNFSPVQSPSIGEKNNVQYSANAYVIDFADFAFICLFQPPATFRDPVFRSRRACFVHYWPLLSFLTILGTTGEHGMSYFSSKRYWDSATAIFSAGRARIRSIG